MTFDLPSDADVLTLDAYDLALDLWGRLPELPVVCWECRQLAEPYSHGCCWKCWAQARAQSAEWVRLGRN